MHVLLLKITKLPAKNFKKRQLYYTCIQSSNSLSLLTLTSFKCSLQQVLFLQKYFPVWQEQPQAVRGALPRLIIFLFRALQAVQRPCIGRRSPLLVPVKILFVPSRI